LQVYSLFLSLEPENYMQDEYLKAAIFLAVEAAVITTAIAMIIKGIIRLMSLKTMQTGNGVLLNMLNG
jgi:hypothetical protein